MIRPFGVTACIVVLLLHVSWGLYVVASRWTGISWMAVVIIAMFTSVPLLAAYG